MYAPSALGLIFNPYYILRRGLYREISRQSRSLTGRLLDFGYGQKPYRSLFNVNEYVGLDTDASGHSHSDEDIDVLYDGRTVPFARESFDSIFSSQVLEHVSDIQTALSELHRVLKTGGLLLLTVPFVWDEHEMPYDFRRFTSAGLMQHLQQAGFRVVQLTKVGGFVESVFQLWNAYLCHRILSINPYVKYALAPFMFAPTTVLGILLSKLLPHSDSLYLTNVVLATKEGGHPPQPAGTSQE